MEENKKILQAGALFHDIGKLTRRSGSMSKDHSEEGIKYLKDNRFFSKEETERILEIIRYHHGKELKNADISDESLAYIVYEADNIASSIDRRKYDDEKTKGREKDYLNSVFNVLKPSESIENKKFRINQLRKEEFNMPLNIKGTASEGEFKGLLETFNNNLSALKEINLDRILTIMENIFSYFPSSSYVDRPDISLYDHLKLTTALSACMYDYDKVNGNTNYKKEYFENTDSRQKKKFLLVSGEFSGIQNFIYTISSKMAMKSLRGRSFYLELLTENIIDEILKELNLTRANLIYSGGSHFYLILSNTEHTKETIESYKTKINDFLLKNHGVNLYFDITSTETNSKELKNNEKNILGELFRILTLKTSKNKVQRYNENQLKKIFDENSEVNKIRSSTKECIICKKAEDEKILEQNAQIYHGSEICSECISFIELGSELSKNYNKNKDHFFVVDKDSNQNKLKIPLMDGSNGYINIKTENNLLDTLEMEEKPVRIYSINSQYSGEFITNNIWVGNYNISDQGELIEFKNLSKKSKGIKRLAVMRADIDNLGKIFQNGFEGKVDSIDRYKYTTLSRTAVLSKYMSDFFKRKINLILEKKENILLDNEIFTKYENIITEDSQNSPRDIVIVYSGGDDMFVVGAWNQVIEFAVDLYRSFKEFTNSKITFSAGIGIFKDTYPINQMAEITGSLEDKAKNNNYPLKNSIALFGEGKDSYGNEDSHLYNWEVFIEIVLNEKYKFIKENTTLEDDDKSDKIYLGKSIIYRLISLIRSSRKDNDNRIDIARFAYTLARINKKKNQIDSYNIFKRKMFEWIKNDEEANQLLTALILIVYEHRESEE